jgi:hypothetical protein
METMNCQECRKWWSPYLDSELDAHTTFQVAEHLRACPSCRERFEREAYFEDWLRTKLRRDHMPTDVWGALCDQVRGTRTSAGGTDSGAWRGRWALRGLALAAAVGLIVIGGLLYTQWERGSGGDTQAPPVRIVRGKQSIADILQDRSPTLIAFDEAPADDFARRLAELSRKCLDASLTIDPARSDGHPLELICVREARDRAGNPYLEVRLNCCGRPVVLAITKAGATSCVTELCECTEPCEKPCRSGCPKSPPIKVRSFERDGVMIAAATADHYLAGIAAAIGVHPITP